MVHKLQICIQDQFTKCIVQHMHQITMHHILNIHKICAIHIKLHIIHQKCMQVVHIHRLRHSHDDMVIHMDHHRAQMKCMNNLHKMHLHHHLVKLYLQALVALSIWNITRVHRIIQTIIQVLLVSAIHEAYSHHIWVSKSMVLY